MAAIVALGNVGGFRLRVFEKMMMFFFITIGKVGGFWWSVSENEGGFSYQWLFWRGNIKFMGNGSRKNLNQQNLIESSIVVLDNNGTDNLHFMAKSTLIYLRGENDSSFR